MALQSDAIESRLEGLKVDDQRMMFDSQLRAFRMDGKSPNTAEDRAPRSGRKSASDDPIVQVIGLIEELSRRIDGLERKDRALADEIRQRARKDHRRRTLCLAGGLGMAVLIGSGWLLRWF